MKIKLSQKDRQSYGYWALEIIVCFSINMYEIEKINILTRYILQLLLFFMLFLKFSTVE